MYKMRLLLLIGFLYENLYASDVVDKNIEEAIAEANSAEELIAAFGETANSDQMKDTEVQSVANTQEAAPKIDIQNQDSKTETQTDQTSLKRFRTCARALEHMIKNGTCIIDLSNVSDFAQFGEKTISAYYNRLKETNTSGTYSNNVYINLSNTGVTEITVAKFAGEFAKDKKRVIWNLSHNHSIDDAVVDALSATLQSVYSLNLSNTNLTDVGLSKIISAIKTNGLGELIVIDVSKTKVTEEGANNLRTAMKEALEKWQKENPLEVRNLQGKDGVIFMLKPGHNLQPKKPEITTFEQAEKILQENLNEDKLVGDDVLKTDDQLSNAIPETTVEKKSEAVDEIDAIMSKYNISVGG